MSEPSSLTGPLGPLRFRPLFKRAIWGGRRLQTVLGKALGPGDDYAESWEVSDHGPDQSVVAEGPHCGKTLEDLVAKHNTDLLGKHAGLDRFPLLVKWIDAHDRLSVQVHPNDEQAAVMVPGERGKTEAWLVLSTEPGSRIYAGLKPGVRKPELEGAIAGNRIVDCLHHFEPKPGDCVFIPAGTVHALGAGILLYEVQQTSDVTFRLFDWDRSDHTGKRRPLHLAESLEVIDFTRGPVEPRQGRPSRIEGAQRETLVECDYFMLDVYRTSGPFTLGGDDRFHIVTVFDGHAELSATPSEREQKGRPGNESSFLWKLKCGDTFLLPACGPAANLQCASATVVDCSLP